MANKENAMKVQLTEKFAYIEVDGGDMLCIGSREEVHEASVERLVEMICEALAIAHYNEITTTGRRQVH